MAIAEPNHQSGPNIGRRQSPRRQRDEKLSMPISSYHKIAQSLGGGQEFVEHAVMLRECAFDVFH
jgi:hypothetical protein